MASVEERLIKLREERIAREQLRLDKLRELNLKKYSKNEPQSTTKPFLTSLQNAKPDMAKVKSNPTLKNNFHVNGTTKRPISVPALIKDRTKDELKPKALVNTVKTRKAMNEARKVEVNKPEEKKVPPKTDIIAKNIANVANNNKIPKPNGIIPDNHQIKTNAAPVHGTSRKSIFCKPEPLKPINVKPKPNESRKSLLPQKSTQSASKANPNRQSVFERLYQPKIQAKKPIDDVQKLQKDPEYLKKLVKTSGLIISKRHTVFETKKTEVQTVRRSISAVHFKRIRKDEINNCIHKWSSIGDKLDTAHLTDINEDHNIKEDKIVSAVKSDRKKVKFQTPIPYNFNTPKPEELQARLQSWLQKRGKSLSSYHHLQCFGIHHLPQEIKPVKLEEAKFEEFEDEDKENVPLESDSDNDSYTDIMNGPCDGLKGANGPSEDVNDVGSKWRRASLCSDSVDMNDTQDTTMTPESHVDDLLVGALNDLTELLREGLEWEQGARWLRGIRTRCPAAPTLAAYWECRAALEERRGDLTASVHCWEEAIAKGTEHSVVEANLDQLLDKFMQLKISPNSAKGKQPDPKMVDVKNVFKSTVIRFAVQQAKLRQSMQPEQPRYTVTPVRRSGRLSAHWSGKRTPLQICATVRQAGLLGPIEFVPNDTLRGTP